MIDNILLLLKPKKMIGYLEENQTLRQGLEIMRFHGYTALPVINENGQYIGTVSEGDFLWNILETKNYSIFDQEKHSIKEILREGFNPPVKVTTPVENLVSQIMNQNFVPVIDDQGVLMGIVTRQNVIRYLTEKTCKRASD
ncbi:MAG: CBS domain-containing protein [Erysipelotrichaceae bacterium]|nr:CBS domain-containing protein [Erysipelotrichaceae bacterium]